jgi:hypothetical protein
MERSINTPVLRGLLLSLALIGAGCEPPPPDIAFTGTWTVQKENGVADEKSLTTVQVTVAGNRFKTEAKNPDEEIIEIYDGEHLTSKKTDFSQSAASNSPVESTVAISNNEMEPRRFWKKNMTGDSLPGGQIAGRETLLYQIQENLPGKKMTRQSWVDAETKVLLKNIFTVYSVQLDLILSKTTEECQEIHYGPVNNAVFAKN